MRFNLAWSEVLSQNFTLKSVILALSICFCLLTVLTVKMAFREPVIVERSCFSKAISNGNSERTKDEIEAFIKVALSQRFDSQANPSSEVLTSQELSTRTQEQKELLSKNMIQKVLVNSVQINGSEIKVDADRLISVGNVRTALLFPLTVTISSTNRSDGNPYGLMINHVTQVSKKEGDQ